MNIAILGYGTVGQGVDKVLKNNEHVKVKRIFDRPERIDSDVRKTSVINDILDDESIDGIVETMGGIDVPFEFITKAMSKGKFVVTANKAVVAAHFETLHNIAKEENVFFLYEASVGGVLPILNSVKRMRRIESISSVGGILNGTSNYILDAMYKHQLPFSLALQQAKDAGYAESDPSADIDGIDVKNKIMILGSLAFKANLDYDAINVSGIRHISKEDIEFFKKQNAVCKLFATATLTEDTYTSTVEPVIFLKESIYANVSVNNNAAFVVGDNSGEIIIHGQGAGQLPTAHAVVEDLMDIYENHANNFEATTILKHVYSSNKETYYLRTSAVIESGKKLNDNTYIFENITKNEWFKFFKDIKLKDNEAFYARYDNKCWEGIKKGEVVYD